MSLNPWALLGIVLAWIASMTGAYLYGNHVGSVSTKAEWQGQQIDQLKTANAEIARLNTAARTQEATQATALAVQGADYEKQLQDAEDRRRDDVARARSGALIVRVPGACTDPGPSSPPQATAPAGRSDGPSSCELSAKAGGDLLDLIADADRNTRQLTACQTVIDTYLKGQQ